MENLQEWVRLSDELLHAAEAALHLLETPGDFNDGERVAIQDDLDVAIRDFKGDTPV